MKRLKRNQLFFGTLLMMTFLLGTAVPALAGQTPGVLDCVEGDSVRGWAWNSSDPASAVEVKVTVTNQATGQTEAEYTAPADDYREDLVRKGTGTGNYGFEVIVPWESYEDGSYLVEAYASGMKLSSPKVHSVGDMQVMSSDGSAGSSAPSVSLRPPATARVPPAPRVGDATPAQEPSPPPTTRSRLTRE